MNPRVFRPWRRQPPVRRTSHPCRAEKAPTTGRGWGAEVRELEAIHRLSEIVLRPGGLDEIFRAISREVSVATGFPIVVIKHHDTSRRAMTLDAAYGLDGAAGPTALEVPLDETLSGTVVRTGQTLIQAHVWGRSAHANKTLQRLGVKTLVVVPMTVGSAWGGVTLPIGRGWARQVTCASRRPGNMWPRSPNAGGRSDLQRGHWARVTTPANWQAGDAARRSPPTTHPGGPGPW